MIFFKKYEIQVFDEKARSVRRFNCFKFASASKKYIEQIKLFGYNNVRIMKWYKPYYFKNKEMLEQISEVLEDELLSNYPTRNK